MTPNARPSSFKIAYRFACSSLGWDAPSTTNHRIIIQTLNDYTFQVRRAKWRGTFCTKMFFSLRGIGFSTSPRNYAMVTNFLEKNLVPILSHPYVLKMTFPVGGKSKRVSPVRRSKFRSVQKWKNVPGSTT